MKRKEHSILRNFLAEHIKYYQEAWKEEKVKYFRNFPEEHIFNLPRRIM